MSLLPHAPVKDEVLVQRLRDGDAIAGDALVERYGRMLLGYLYRLTGNSQLAEELHQQIWLSVLEHLDRFEDKSGGGFKAWLFRIATNKANDLWRSGSRRRKAEAGLRQIKEPYVPDASAPAESVEMQQKLRQAIEELPEAQRQVVLMRYYAEMKFVEIAETLGCPLNTALGRMHKAVEKLKRLMEAN